MRSPETLRILRDTAIRENIEYAKRLGVAPSLSVTAIKPSGTVSQMVNCASGVHPRHAEYYIRRIRISATDALFKLVRAQGIPYHPEVGQTGGAVSTFVLEFPVQAPAGSVFKNDMTAIEQLEYWKMVKQDYTEHNPSATISVGDGEWIGVVQWIEDNWDIIGGLSFLPRHNHLYSLAPYEAIDQETYKRLTVNFPVIDYSKLVMFEQSDETEQVRELACAGGVCDMDPVFAAVQ